MLFYYYIYYMPYSIYYHVAYKYILKLYINFFLKNIKNWSILKNAKNRWYMQKTQELVPSMVKFKQRFFSARYLKSQELVWDWFLEFFDIFRNGWPIFNIFNNFLGDLFLDFLINIFGGPVFGIFNGGLILGIFLGGPIFWIFMGGPIFGIFIGGPIFEIFMGGPIFEIFKKYFWRPFFEIFY